MIRAPREELIYAGIDFRIALDTNRRPEYYVASIELPELARVVRGELAADNLTRRIAVSLFDPSVLGFGDAHRHPERERLTIHRTMNFDTSEGYAVPSSTFRASASSLYPGDVTSVWELAFNTLPALVYTVHKQVIRVAPGGHESTETSFSYPILDSTLYNSVIYLAFGDNDNIWSRSVSGTNVSFTRQPAVITTLSEEAVAASADDVEQTSSGGLGSLTATTVRTGRLADASVTPSVASSTSDASQAGTGAATSAGPRDGGTFANDTTGGTVAWSNVANAGASDDSYATAVLSTGQTSNKLDSTNFGFTLPAAAIINGIKVEVEGMTSGSGLPYWKYQLLKANVAVGSTYQSLRAAVELYDSKGGPTDLWGAAWTRADINDAGFGFHLWVYQGTAAGTTSIDHVRITVYYTINNMDLTSVTLPHDVTSGEAYIGLRVASVSVPLNATIVSAKLTIEINGAVPTYAGTLTIHGFATDDMTAFASSPNDISSRAVTTNSAVWAPATGGIAGDRIDTSSIVSVVQELVNRSGWASGQAMGFRIYITGNTSNTLADVFRSYDNAAGDAATLTITYRDSTQAGYRFTTVPIPVDATIVSASIKRQASASDSNSVVTRIYGELAANPAAWSATHTPGAAVLTTAYKDGTQGAVTINTDYTSEDITAVVQEIVNQSGWASNNALCIIERDHSLNAASVSHTWYSQDDAGSGNEARFNCTYSTSGNAPIKARRLLVGRKGLYRAYADNQVALCPWGLSPMLSLSWSAPTGATNSRYVRTNDWPINALAELGDQLLAVKGDGLYKLNPSEGDFDNIMPELSTSPHALHGDPSFVWKYILLMSLADGRLIAYNGAQVQDVTPLRSTHRTSETVPYGRITAFAGDAEYLYAVTEPYNIRAVSGVNTTFEKTIDGGTNYTSYATEVTDDDPATVADLTNLDVLANNDWVIVGSDIVPMGWYVTVSAPNTTASILTAQYWNGAWTARTVYDNTDSNGATLGQSGAIYWLTQPTDAVKSTLNGKSRYWTRLSFSNMLSSCQVSDVAVIPGKEDLPAASYGTYTGADRAGLLSHILRGRLRRYGEEWDNDIIWTDIAAIPHGPFTRMAISASSLGFRTGRGPVLWVLGRRARYALALPQSTPLQEAYYLSKNADTNDGDKSANIIWLTAHDGGIEGSKAWVDVHVEGRNLQGDDRLECYYRAGEPTVDTRWERIGQASALPADFVLPTTAVGRWLEVAIGLRDNDNNDQEPPIITHVKANAVRMPPVASMYQFAVHLDDDMVSSTGMIRRRYTAQEKWARLLATQNQVTKMTTPDGEDVWVVPQEINRQDISHSPEKPPTSVVQIKALRVA